jgi:hypothetical protein
MYLRSTGDKEMKLFGFTRFGEDQALYCHYATLAFTPRDGGSKTKAVVSAVSGPVGIETLRKGESLTIRWQLEPPHWQFVDAEGKNVGTLRPGTYQAAAEYAPSGKDAAFDKDYWKGAVASGTVEIEIVEPGKGHALAPAGELNRQIAEFNAGRQPDMGITPIDKKVARVEYLPAEDAVRCFDQSGQAFLTLKRQADGQFKGTLETEFHELVSDDKPHGWGTITATFTLPGDLFSKPAKAGDAQKPDAEKAKAALLEYIRANPKTFDPAFVGRLDSDKLTAVPLTARDNGRFSFGAFEIDVDKKSWSAWPGQDAPHSTLYEGKFTVNEAGCWRAEPPNVSRFRRPEPSPAR